jgi:hypothetical protein
MTDVNLMALRRVAMNGASAPRTIPAPMQGPQQTNDLGEFRIIGLPPGEYIVAATLRRGFGFGAPAITPSSSGTVSTTTYFPGTVDQVAAQTLTVLAGQTVDNVNFSMQSVPGFQVAGRVVDESGAPIAGAMVMLMADPRGGVPFLEPMGNVRTGDDGRFLVADVPSGTYRLTASVPFVTGGAASGAAVGAGGGGVVGTSVSGGFGGSTFTSWSIVGGTTTGFVGGMPQPTEVVVNGANVTGVRLVTRRPTPQ